MVRTVTGEDDQTATSATMGFRNDVVIAPKVRLSSVFQFQSILSHVLIADKLEVIKLEVSPVRNKLFQSSRQESNHRITIYFCKVVLLITEVVLECMLALPGCAGPLAPHLFTQSESSDK